MVLIGVDRHAPKNSEILALTEPVDVYFAGTERKDRSSVNQHKKDINLSDDSDQSGRSSRTLSGSMYCIHTFVPSLVLFENVHDEQIINTSLESIRSIGIYAAECFAVSNSNHGLPNSRD